MDPEKTEESEVTSETLEFVKDVETLANDQTEEADETDTLETEADTSQVETKKAVPLAALQDERTKRQVLEGQLDSLTKKFDRVVEALIASQPQKKEEELPTLPDFNVDPLGHLKVALELAEAKIKALTEGNTKTSQAMAQKAEVDQLSTRWLADITRFAATTPDVHEAFKFLSGSRAEELKDVGYSDQEVFQIISADTRELVQRAYKQGKDPVDILYKAAKKRGYATKGEANGQKKAETKDPRIVRGFDQRTTKQAGPITSDSIAKMTEEEFEAFMKGKNWRDLHR